MIEKVISIPENRDIFFLRHITTFPNTYSTTISVANATFGYASVVHVAEAGSKVTVQYEFDTSRPTPQHSIKIIKVHDENFTKEVALPIKLEYSDAKFLGVFK